MAKAKPKDYPLTIVQFDANFELPLPIFYMQGFQENCGDQGKLFWWDSYMDIANYLGGEGGEKR